MKIIADTENVTNGESVSICFSKRAAKKKKFSETKKVKLIDQQKKTNKNILVIGGGVAGLACAAELKRFGHNVTIYERHKSLGGMLNQGIPVFRLPRKLIEKEVKQIIDLGVKVELNRSVKSSEINQLSKNSML